MDDRALIGGLLIALLLFLTGFWTAAGWVAAITIVLAIS